MGLSSFKFEQWAPKDASFLRQSEFWPFKVIQGHPRSIILVPIESAYTTSWVMSNDVMAAILKAWCQQYYCQVENRTPVDQCDVATCDDAYSLEEQSCSPRVLRWILGEQVGGLGKREKGKRKEGGGENEMEEKPGKGNEAAIVLRSLLIYSYYLFCRKLCVMYSMQYFLFVLLLLIFVVQTTVY